MRTARVENHWIHKQHKCFARNPAAASCVWPDAALFTAVIYQGRSLGEPPPYQSVARNASLPDNTVLCYHQRASVVSSDLWQVAERSAGWCRGCVLGCFSGILTSHKSLEFSVCLRAVVYTLSTLYFVRCSLRAIESGWGENVRHWLKPSGGQPAILCPLHTAGSPVSCPRSPIAPHIGRHRRFLPAHTWIIVWNWGGGVLGHIQSAATPAQRAVTLSRITYCGPKSSRQRIGRAHATSTFNTAQLFINVPVRFDRSQ